VTKGPILEPKGIDLVIEGGDFSVNDLIMFRALLHKSQDDIAGTAKRKSAARPKTKRTKS
jgi:hypothetical protein